MSIVLDWFPEKRLWGEGWLGYILRGYTCNHGVKQAGLGRGRSCPPVMPQLILGEHELGWLFRVIPNWGKGLGVCSPVLVADLMGEDIAMLEVASWSQQQPPVRGRGVGSVADIPVFLGMVLWLWRMDLRKVKQHPQHFSPQVLFKKKKSYYLFISIILPSMCSNSTSSTVSWYMYLVL